MTTTPRTNTKESGFEEYIEQQLVELHGYQNRPASKYKKPICMDSELLVQFLKTSQLEEWAKLEEQYSEHTAESVLMRIDDEIAARGVVDVFRNGVKDRGVKIELFFTKPENDLNPDTAAQYEQNVFSVMRQVKYSEKNENCLDMVLCVNGLPFATLELKNQFTSQNAFHAAKQYREDRDEREKLFHFKRCAVHFAVDTEQALMTTKLAGMSTFFLPFNKGVNGGAGNLAVEGAYKTAYLWEEVFSKDSISDLIENFIQEQVEEETDEKGRVRKKEKLIFPRYHQHDTVLRLLADAREHGPGRKYLVQHSAGSGKSNTIAWAAHRLADLHNAANENVFDTVVVITDRRVLDKQLSETVNSFSQVTGLVKHVESSAELKEALENGVRIVTSTLQKFPVIVDAIDKAAGNSFAVLIDEAHSSQTGESAADLRSVLSGDDLDSAAAAEEGAQDTVEDMIIKRMKARKIATPHISFFAFTATPKQKTLELFGTEDPLTGKYVPFSLYSMKQAIEERFIVDVLKNYTTYQTYFGLLKKTEDDPEFNKKKAQRLMIGYVEKHEHAIGKKVEIMVEHFAEKIANELDGKAKAMVVTKSRLHAVRYKQAFDKYLNERNYSYKAMVAFSGTVKDAELEYTEKGMNGFSDKRTADEFKKDEYKFMIVAEKFQTGFDQPLLTAMYVDKKLSGVSAVQTLSRLNRTAPGKENVFVLDFVNDTEDIKDAFQPYYTTTVLSEATDPNILHDLERDISQFKVFTDFEVNGFVEEYFRGAKPNALNAIIDSVVERVVAEKSEEEIEQLKSLVADYLRKYAFVSQIITFEDPQLEKLFYFLKFLKKKLPMSEDKLPLEVLEAIDMETYKVSKQADSAIELEDEEGVVDPMSTDKSQSALDMEERDFLSQIIQEVNERYGADLGEDAPVIMNSLSERLVRNEALVGSIENNSTESAKMKYAELFQDELLGMVDNHFTFYRALDERPELKQFVKDRIYEHVVKKLG